MLQNIKYYWRLVRPINLGIVILTQFIFIFHAANFTLENIRFPDFYWLLIAVTFTTAAGYVINDIFDIEEDSINIPKFRIVSQFISLRKSRIYYVILLGTGILTGFISSVSIGILCTAVSLMLYFYSSDLKGTNLWGNLMVSFITSAVIFTASRAVFTFSSGYFAEYSFLAFVISMAREIVKDMEDIEGDKAQQYSTFPIIHGFQKATYLVVAFIGLMLTSLFFLMLFYGNLWYVIYTILAVIIPGIYIIKLLFSASEKKHYSTVSLYIKLLMLTGICSVLLL